MNKKTRQYITELDSVYDLTFKNIAMYVTAKVDTVKSIENILTEIYCEIYADIQGKGMQHIGNIENYAMNVAKKTVYKYYNFEACNNATFSILSEETINEVDLNTFDYSFLDKVPDEELLKYITTLDLLTQKICIMYYVLGADIRKISNLLGCSEYTIKLKINGVLYFLRNKYVGGKKDEQIK
ncbi:MAG: hypothetical protein RR922_01490 [Clostridia bacterium]